MIKTIKQLAYLSIALMCLASCNKWLEATSSTQVSDATLFSSRSGFQDALCGVYISMGDQYEYGSAWTWYVNELSYGPYAQQFSPVFTAIQNHEWDNSRVTVLTESMWKAGYYTIANINKVLYEIDAKPDVVSDNTERNLMKGELLALRACIHFDMIRMFGLVQLSEGDFEKYTVPYVTAYDKEPTPQRTYRETLALLESDLDTAISLLESDPVRGNASESFMNNANADGFWDARDKRMNYFAAKALRARVLLFRYDLDAAAAAAQEVIDEARAAGAYKWVDADAMTKATSNDVVDWTFSSESLFSLEVSGLQSLTDQYIFNDLGAGASSLFIDKSFADLTLFNPAFISSSEDIRGPALMLKFYANHYRPYKYYNNSSYYSEYRNRVPMIKISEMYLIVAEAAAEKGDMDAVKSAIGEIVAHRGVQDVEAYFLDASYTNSALFSKVHAEYIKEFYGEGIAYYATRRIIHKGQVYMNIDLEWYGRMQSLSAYPYPTDELSYGRHQDL
ncbi:MAG: RagB/SusD family nutrient uptake outer membrane protein [Bacteroidales bacterium]|nr:RagB/SusD family nutrient uptake outer membrane protein [Bacteroidales bacterium]